jgi:hypothetical protein
MRDYQRSFPTPDHSPQVRAPPGHPKNDGPKTGLAPTLLLGSARGSELRFVGNGEVVQAISDLVLAEGQFEMYRRVAASWEWDGFHARWRGSM